MEKGSWVFFVFFLFLFFFAFSLYIHNSTMVPNLQIRVPAGSPKKFLESSCSSPTTPVSYNYNHLQFEQYHHYHYQQPQQKQKPQPQQQHPTPPSSASSAASTSLSTSDKVGFILNNTYYLIKVLGSGACGTVYYAKCLTSGKEVAIKTMLKPAPNHYSSYTTPLNLEQCHFNNTNSRHNHIVATPISLSPDDAIFNQDSSAPDAPRSSRSANLNKALYNEVYLHSSVHNHPNVLPVLQVLDSENYLFVVLEYCPLGDLFTAITERNWYVGDDNYVKAMFTQLLDSVDHCHKRDVYHCDLKPENIMVDKQGRRLKIADFGLASKNPICTVFGRGSSYYMAPETIPENVIYRHVSKGSSSSDQEKRSSVEQQYLEAQRKADIEHRKRYHNQKRSKRPLQSKGYPRSSSDVWALGVILLNLVFGRNPWKKASLTEDSAYKDYSANPNTLKGVLPVSDELNSIMAQVFHPDPYKRIQIPELRKRILACKKLTNPSPNFPWFLPFVRKAEKQQQQQAAVCSPAVITPKKQEVSNEEKLVAQQQPKANPIINQVIVPQPQPSPAPSPIDSAQAIIQESVEQKQRPAVVDVSAGSSSSSLSDALESSSAVPSSIVESVLVTSSIAEAVVDNSIIPPSQVYYYSSPTELVKPKKTEEKKANVLTVVSEKNKLQHVGINHIENFDIQMDTTSTGAGTSTNGNSLLHQHHLHHHLKTANFGPKRPVGSAGSIGSGSSRVFISTRAGNTVNISPPGSSIATTHYNSSGAEDYYGNNSNSMRSSSLMFSSTSSNSTGGSFGGAVASISGTSPSQRKRKIYEEEFTATGIVGGGQFRGKSSINHSFGVQVPCSNNTNCSILNTALYVQQQQGRSDDESLESESCESSAGSVSSAGNLQQYLLEEQQDLFGYDTLSNYTAALSATTCNNSSSITVDSNGNTNNMTATTAATTATNNSIDYNTYRQKYNKKLNQKPTTMIAAAAAATAAAAHSFQRKMELLYYQSRIGGSHHNEGGNNKMSIVNNVNYNYGSFKRFRSKSFSSSFSSA